MAMISIAVYYEARNARRVESQKKSFAIALQKDIEKARAEKKKQLEIQYRTAIEETANRIESASGSDKVKFTKRLNTLKAQNDEIHAYEEKIHHLADQMICIDIDDGVKKNYEIFKDVLAKIK